MRKVYFISWIMTIAAIITFLIIDLIFAYVPGFEGGVPLSKCWTALLIQIAISPLACVCIMPIVYLMGESNEEENNDRKDRN